MAPTSPTATLSVSVVVPTRNRPTQIGQCVETLLAVGGFKELIVIDQSDGTDTEKILSNIVDRRLRYVRTDTRGVTLARNLGIQLSSGEIVACTDDDCRATPDWAGNIVAIFSSDPQVAVVCGRVRVPDEVWGAGFTLGFEPHEREWYQRFPPPERDWGITANLALRKDIIARVGDFDPVLGSGAPLVSGGEPDFIFRVLRAGFKVVNASEVVVEHYGVRTAGRETRRLVRGYASGTGAAFWKHVRLGDRQALGIYLAFIGVNLREVTVNLRSGRRPQGLAFLVAFLSGTVKSYQFRIDRRTRQYIRR